MYDNLVVKKGSNVTLICRKEFLNLDEKVLWSFVYHDHIIPQTSTNKKYMEKFHPTGERTFSLHITNVSKKYVGKYICSAYSKGFGRYRRGHLNRILEDFIDLKLYESGK